MKITGIRRELLKAHIRDFVRGKHPEKQINAIQAMYTNMVRLSIDSMDINQLKAIALEHLVRDKAKHWCIDDYYNNIIEEHLPTDLTDFTKKPNDQIKTLVHQHLEEFWVPNTPR